MQALLATDQRMKSMEDAHIIDSMRIISAYPETDLKKILG